MITLQTLKDATAQQVFDQCKAHLLAQGKKSSALVDGRKTCYYKAGDMKCAAGCFISKKQYKPSFENETWNSLVDRNAVPEYHSDLIRALQRIHDGEKPSRWKSKLNVLEKKLNEYSK